MRGGPPGLFCEKPCISLDIRSFLEDMLKPRRMMDTPVAPSLKPLMDNSLVKTREKASLIQVLSLKASSMQKVIQIMRKSCVTAFRFMCLPLESPLCDRLLCSSAHSQQHKKDKTKEEALQGLRSTVLIVNISNSTLNDCIIGDNTYQSTVADRQPLMQQSEHFTHGQRTCSCSHGLQGTEQVSSACPPQPPPSDAEQLSISIQSSHLNCVIIGDNSSMHAEQGEPFEWDVSSSTF